MKTTENENIYRCHLKLGVQPVGRLGNMHTRKLPGFCGKVSWMTVGCEDCGSLAAEGTRVVAPAASAETCFCGAATAATGAATQRQQTASVLRRGSHTHTPVSIRPTPDQV